MRLLALTKRLSVVALGAAVSMGMAAAQGQQAESEAPPAAGAEADAAADVDAAAEGEATAPDAANAEVDAPADADANADAAADAEANTEAAADSDQPADAAADPTLPQPGETRTDDLPRDSADRDSADRDRDARDQDARDRGDRRRDRGDDADIRAPRSDRDANRSDERDAQRESDLGADLGVEFDAEAESDLQFSNVAEDGLAARAGLRAGDRIERLGNQRLNSRDQFQRNLRGYYGRRVPAVIWRDGNQQRIMLDLSSLGGQNLDRNYAGLGVGLGSRGDAVLVSGVFRDSPAARAGFRAGDELVSINGQRVTSISDTIGTIQELNVGEQATIVVRRNGQLVEMRPQLVAYSEAVSTEADEFGQQGRRQQVLRPNIDGQRDQRGTDADSRIEQLEQRIEMLEMQLKRLQGQQDATIEGAADDRIDAPPVNDQPLGAPAAPGNVAPGAAAPGAAGDAAPPLPPGASLETETDSEAGRGVGADPDNR